MGLARWPAALAREREKERVGSCTERVGAPACAAKFESRNGLAELVAVAGSVLVEEVSSGRFFID